MVHGENIGNMYDSTMFSDDCTYAYNLNSAPVAITRRGDDEGRHNVLVDDLTLTYEGNRLVNVSDSGEEVLLEASGDFVDGATGSGEEYAYDANGNMVRDDNRGIRKIVYNCINQPSDIVVGKYENQKMHYDYAADGRKLATYASETMVRIIRDPVDPIIPEVPVIKDEISDSLLIGEFDPVVVGPIVRPINTPSIKLQREYVDNIEYVDGELSRINTPYGYYNAADSLFYAYQTDRQGNIRVVYTARDNENWQEVWDDNPDDNPKVFYDVVQSTSYYPYGMPIAHGTGAGKNPYKFGGKEYETRFGLNLYDFVARGYDPALGIFLRPDPKAPDFTPFNPYLYCAANPILYIDPTGMVWDFADDAIREFMESLANKSVLFKLAFDHIASIDRVITAKFGETSDILDNVGNVVGKCPGEYSATTGTLTLDNNQNINAMTIAEEVYHIVQDNPPAGVNVDKSENPEFEAKVFTLGVCNEAGEPGNLQFMDDVSLKIINHEGIAGFLKISNSYYISQGQNYAENYRKFLNYPENYKKHVTRIPPLLHYFMEGSSVRSKIIGAAFILAKKYIQ